MCAPSDPREQQQLASPKSRFGSCSAWPVLSTVSTQTWGMLPCAMQRVYGITFPDKDSMKEYQHRIEEAKKRDHRLLGTQQELFFFDRLSPGSCFFLPNGAVVYNNLIEVRKRMPDMACNNDRYGFVLD